MITTYRSLREGKSALIRDERILGSRVRSVREADSFLPEPMSQLISNWCQDYEMELGNAALSDRAYLKIRISYCHDFCRIFPRTDAAIIINMLRGEAESWARLGEIKRAEKLFKSLVKKFPRNPWAYVAWGDFYSDRDFYGDEIKIDYDRAAEIFRSGLSRCDTETDVLKERLAELGAKNEG